MSMCTQLWLICADQQWNNNTCSWRCVLELLWFKPWWPREMLQAATANYRAATWPCNSVEFKQNHIFPFISSTSGAVKTLLSGHPVSLEESIPRSVSFWNLIHFHCGLFHHGLILPACLPACLSACYGKMWTFIPWVVKWRACGRNRVSVGGDGGPTAHWVIECGCCGSMMPVFTKVMDKIIFLDHFCRKIELDFTYARMDKQETTAWGYLSISTIFISLVLVRVRLIAQVSVRSVSVASLQISPRNVFFF